MMLSNNILEEASKKGKLVKHQEETDYSCFREKFRGVSRGTVLVGDRVVYGYPKIPRVYSLQKGIEKNLGDCKVWVEEKIDGYNIRVAKFGKRLFAFSRSGFIDPFSTEKVRELSLEGFFEAYPDHVLCGEMIGNTPYSRPVKGFDVRFLVFDIVDGSDAFIFPEKRYELLKKYGLNGVPVMGKFSTKEIKKIKSLFASANKAKKEGIIIKSEDRRKAIKCVTPVSDLDDISQSAHAFFDMPTGFFHQRILRSAVSLQEFGFDRKNSAAQLGRAFYEKLFFGFEQLRKSGEIYDEFEILIKNPLVWDGILKHMSKLIKIEVVSRKKEKGGLRIRFRKIYKESSRKLREVLSGKSFDD